MISSSSMIRIVAMEKTLLLFSTRAEFLSPVRVLPSTQGERIKYSRRWQ